MADYMRQKTTNIWGWRHKREGVMDSRSGFGGPLALVSKVSTEVGEEEIAKEEEDGFIINSDDEVVAYYANNKVKKFFKKPFNPNFQKKYDNKPGSSFRSGSGSAKDTAKATESDEKKIGELLREVKLKGDTGINCHFYNGHNHFAKDCLLRQREEKKEREKDEAYYVERLEAVRNQGKSLVAKGYYDSDGTYQIWSSGSDDEEMRHPTHGAMFAKFEEGGEEDDEHDV